VSRVNIVKRIKSDGQWKMLSIPRTSKGSQKDSLLIGRVAHVPHSACDESIPSSKMPFLMSAGLKARRSILQSPGRMIAFTPSKGLRTFSSRMASGVQPPSRITLLIRSPSAVLLVPT
jgi:hypothetical protein